MHKHSRRDFLAHSAAGAMALGAGGLFASQTLAADQAADMTIARWSGAKELSAGELKQAAVKLTEKAIEGLGGLKRFLGNGAVVWIKPNIGWDRTPEQAANTNPDVVATIIRLCLEAGAKKIKIGDNPCDIAQKTYVTSGIAAAAKELGAEVIFLDRSRFKETEIGGERLKSHPVFPEIMECDLVINVPVAKHHRLTNATLCMKNYLGVVEKRQTFHQAMPECVADLTRFMKPKLCILDAVRILKDHGPKGGNLADVEMKLTVAAGVDIVALDAFGAELLGRKATEIKTITKGAAVGLGKIDYRKSALREIAVS